MKSVLKILLFLFASSQLIYGQESRDKLIDDYYKDNPAKYIIKTNPFTIIIGPIRYTSEYRLEFEHSTFKKQSFQIGFSYLGKGPELRSVEKRDSIFLQNHLKLNVNGYRLQFSYKIYFSKKALKGLYLAPHFSNSSVKFKNAKQPQSRNYIHVIYKNFAIKSGYQFLINRKVAIDLFFGYGYKENTWYEVQNLNYKVGDETDAYFIREPIKIYLGFNLGLAF